MGYNPYIKQCWYCRWLGVCKTCKRHNNNGCAKGQYELTNGQKAQLLGISWRTYYRRMLSPVWRHITAVNLRALGYEVFEEENEHGRPCLVVFKKTMTLLIVF